MRKRRRKKRRRKRKRRKKNQRLLLQKRYRKRSNLSGQNLLPLAFEEMHARKRASKIDSEMKTTTMTTGALGLWPAE
jgi:hypothetical protein